jgi:uncharacterized protein
MEAICFMRRLLISLFSILFLVPLISAQTADSPSTDDVKKFLEVMRIQRQLNTMLQIMTKSAKAGARQGFLQKMPDATPEQAADVESLADVMFSDLPINEMLSDIIPIYQKHVSKSDLRAITEFYSTPVGQRFLDEQPQMMQEMGAASSGRMQQRLGSMLERFDAKLNELAEKWKKEAAEKSKSPAVKAN